MKSSVIVTSEGRLNTKMPRQKDLKFEMNNSSCPDSYKTNTIKEELCLEYIKSFIDQYQSIHKTRKVPYMVAENEMGVKKFVCTTLRPTLIPIPELYDMYECASFIAGYVIYEPLDPPAEPPKYLFSPSQILDSHIGDAFDMANLLTSFLLGSGYDAYMVCGYAPAFITLKDQSMTRCTMIHEGNESKTRSEQSTIVADANTTNNSAEQIGSTNYVPPDNSVKNSQYLADQAEAKRLAGLDTFQLWIPDAELDEMQMMESMKQLETPSDGKHQRMHAWVLVRSGKRDVKEHVFIEPTTGRIYAVNASPYIAIESVWNHVNFWVNTAQFEEKVSQMQFDLKNESLWDVLFLSSSSPFGEGKDNRGDQGEDNMMHGEENEGNDETKTGSLDAPGRYFDAPPTWANPLAISRSRYLLKYPPLGKRSVQYYCAKADLFARRSHPQCMVMRITTYLDQSCTIVKEIYEWFEGRPDRLYKRIRFFLDNRRFVEFYHPGSFQDVKKWTEYPGKVVECDFYVDGRLDRLARREETIGVSVVEHFSGRADYLTQRTVMLTADRQVVGTRQFPLATGGPHSSELFAVKMTQLYDQDPSVIPSAEASGSVAKRVFNVVEGKAVIYYHFAKGKVTGDVKTYLHAKGPSIPMLSDQALAQEVGLDDSVEALAMASTLERDCFNNIKVSFLQNQKLRETRRDVEHRIEYERTVFEVALENADNAALNQNNVVETVNSDAVGADYLSAFIRNALGAAGGGGGTSVSGLSGGTETLQLTKEDALEIRQACLDALKARLVERANIIQTKLHEENAALGKIQEHFQRAQREGDFDTEKYEATCTAAMFRIQILEQRLSAHEEAALRKFTDLDAKLSNDPRLRVLRS